MYVNLDTRTSHRKRHKPFEKTQILTLIDQNKIKRREQCPGGAEGRGKKVLQPGIESGAG